MAIAAFGSAALGVVGAFAYRAALGSATFPFDSRRSARCVSLSTGVQQSVMAFLTPAI